MRNKFNPFLRNALFFVIVLFGSIFVRMLIISSTAKDPLEKLPDSALIWLVVLLVLEAGGEVLFKVFKNRYRNPYNPY